MISWVKTINSPAVSATPTPSSIRWFGVREAQNCVTRTRSVWFAAVWFAAAIVRRL
jgi:hypothetical protein